MGPEPEKKSKHITYRGNGARKSNTVYVEHTTENVHWNEILPREIILTGSTHQQPYAAAICVDSYTFMAYIAYERQTFSNKMRDFLLFFYYCPALVARGRYVCPAY